MKVLHGIPAAPGQAIGIAHIIRPVPPIDVTAQRTTDPSIEIARIEGAISLEIRLDRAAILVAQDLAPAETVGLDPKLLQAVVTETGSATGHLAIVAQGMGIPAVVGADSALAQIDEGTTLIVDGERGTVTIAPDEASRTEVEMRLAAAQRHKRDLD